MTTGVQKISSSVRTSSASLCHCTVTASSTVLMGVTRILMAVPRRHADRASSRAQTECVSRPTMCVTLRTTAEIDPMSPTRSAVSLLCLYKSGFFCSVLIMNLCFMYRNSGTYRIRRELCSVICIVLNIYIFFKTPSCRKTHCVHLFSLSIPSSLCLLPL